MRHTSQATAGETRERMFRRFGGQVIRHANSSLCHGFVAEREGFEPSMGCPIRHFQCRALGL